MASQSARIGQVENLAIASGGTLSNAIGSKGGMTENLMIYGSNVTDGVLTFNYQVSPDGVNWFDLVDAAAANVVPPLQGKAKDLPYIAPFIRVKASAVTTAIRTWNVSAEI